MSNQKKHYHMGTAEIVFTREDSEVNESIRMNALMVTSAKEIASADLGRFQKAVQMRLFKALDPVRVNVNDVVILAINYLGLMTKDAFHKQEEPVAIPQMQMVKTADILN